MSTLERVRMSKCWIRDNKTHFDVIPMVAKAILGLEKPMRMYADRAFSLTDGRLENRHKLAELEAPKIHLARDITVNM